jgi:hypothetical protein
MATEADKANTGVVLTALAVGTAAMIGGTAAIIGMVRTEVQALNEVESVYADHTSINALKQEQRAKLAGGKLPIQKAAALVLADVKRDPQAASPYTKAPEPVASAAPAPAVTGPGATGEAAVPAVAPSAGSKSE